MYAVVSTGGKQLRVQKDDLVVVEKLEAAVGDSVKLDVLMVADGDSVAVSPEDVGSATVTAEVVEHFKGGKTLVFKLKKRKGHKKLRGHRQELTRIRISDVALAGAKKTRKTSKKTEEAPVSEEVEPEVIAGTVAEAVAEVDVAPANEQIDE